MSSNSGGSAESRRSCERRRSRQGDRSHATRREFPILAANAANAAPTAYTIDPTHTFPSFEADHMGISVWRGMLNKSSGNVLYDKTTGIGSVETVSELASIDFGMYALAVWARGKDFFDVKKYPRAVFKGSLQSPVGGVPTQLVGDLTLRGVA